MLGKQFNGVDRLSEQEFRKRLPDKELRKRHAVPYMQGEAVMHLGKRMHGVLPIEAGKRYTLILMYYEKRLV